MDKLPTKERIGIEAARLFAKKGYGAVSVDEIAQAVGIKAPSLYKHYKNKQEIFDAVLQEMNTRYEKNMAGLMMDGREGAADAPLFEGMSEDQMVLLGKRLFDFFLHDDYAANFRKLLTIEQFQDSELAAMYTKQYTDDPLSYQGMLFAILVQAGVIQAWDTQVMALHFYAPIQLLLSLCDRHPEREMESWDLLERHIRQFHELYWIGDEAYE